MITVALPEDAVEDTERMRICPVGAKTRSEAWQRAAECYAEIQGLCHGDRVVVRDGTFDVGDESTWAISRSVDGRYSAALAPGSTITFVTRGPNDGRPYSRPAGDVEFIVKPDLDR